MGRIVKRGFGPHVSEGQRLLWVALLGRFAGVQARLASEIGCDSGLLNRWLYAEGRPGLRYLSAVARVVPGATYAAFCSPPAARFPLAELRRFVAATSRGAA